MAANKPILCLDFDGVIHAYTSPWTRADEIRDHVTEGFFDWVIEAQERFRLVIYSSRSKDRKAVEAMKKWIIHEAALSAEGKSKEYKILVRNLEFEFANKKPAAFLTIDDRAIQFDGNWKSLFLDPMQLLAFKPWNKR
jgi:hypothetical protein